MFLMVPMQHDNVHMSEVGVHPGRTLDEQNTKHGFKQTKRAGTNSDKRDRNGDYISVTSMREKELCQDE